MAFRLNVQAFATTITGVSPAVVEDAMRNVGVSDWWDNIGANARLSAKDGTKGPRETGDQARERLKELCRWRNHLAHGGDEEVSLSDAQVREEADFVLLFAEELTRTVQKTA